MGDLEVPYRAYGLRGHLGAIIARARAEGRFNPHPLAEWPGEGAC